MSRDPRVIARSSIVFFESLGGEGERKSCESKSISFCFFHFVHCVCFDIRPVELFLSYLILVVVSFGVIIAPPRHSFIC